MDKEVINEKTEAVKRCIENVLKGMEPEQVQQVLNKIFEHVLDSIQEIEMELEDI